MSKMKTYATAARKRRIAELVRRIPRGLETKEQPNELEALATKITDNFTTKITALKTAFDAELAGLKEKGVTDPEAEKRAALLSKRIDGLELELRRPEGQLPPVLQSAGQKFIESPQFKSFVDRGWNRGGAAMKFDGQHNPFFAGQGLYDEQKTTITSAAVGSVTPAILVPQRIPGIVPKPERTLRMRDLIPTRPTTNNAVEYVQESVFTSAASPVVENNAKQESALTFTIASDMVRLIAHWIPASRQILDDFEGLRAFIDHKLMYGLKLKEETELLNGDNLGDHLNGIYTRATAYAGTYAVAGDTNIDKLRRALLELEVADEVPSGIVLHPKNWALIETIKTEEGGANKGMYVVGTPNGPQIIQTLWGVPVVKSNSMTVDTFLVGAFATQATIFDRMQAVIDVSTEHASYFTSNLVAIRAEERLCLACYRTTAFIKGSL